MISSFGVEYEYVICYRIPNAIEILGQYEAHGRAAGAPWVSGGKKVLMECPVGRLKEVVRKGPGNLGMGGRWELFMLGTLTGIPTFPSPPPPPTPPPSPPSFLPPPTA
ncbi:hypothetical protein E2C01_040250 [Portunus trituberculatus]|uniref:Uncharacterized protein n=1 Tax=Portunus trituberculatus TaxID=210409 RepID=A0A5B7FG00_PORTR|nr:hypothetical protein [Portunus trituberculatus]